MADERATTGAGAKAEAPTMEAMMAMVRNIVMMVLVCRKVVFYATNCLHLVIGDVAFLQFCKTKVEVESRSEVQNIPKSF